MLAKNKEKELSILDVADQFIYDIITGWLVVYEQLYTVGTNYTNSFDDAMPKNKSKDLSDLLMIWGQSNSTLPVGWFYQQLNLIMGYTLDPSTDFEQALQDAIRIVDAARGTPEPAPEESLVGAGASTNGSGG